eukprot:11827559-Karenia_brevis.AAC.1
MREVYDILGGDNWHKLVGVHFRVVVSWDTGEITLEGSGWLRFSDPAALDNAVRIFSMVVNRGGA